MAVQQGYLWAPVALLGEILKSYRIVSRHVKTSENKVGPCGHHMAPSRAVHRYEIVFLRCSTHWPSSQLVQYDPSKWLSHRLGWLRSLHWHQRWFAHCSAHPSSDSCWHLPLHWLRDQRDLEKSWWKHDDVHWIEFNLDSRCWWRPFTHLRLPHPQVGLCQGTIVLVAPADDRPITTQRQKGAVGGGDVTNVQQLILYTASIWNFTPTSKQKMRMCFFLWVNANGIQWVSKGWKVEELNCQLAEFYLNIAKIEWFLGDRYCTWTYQDVSGNSQRGHLRVELRNHDQKDKDLATAGRKAGMEQFESFLKQGLNKSIQKLDIDIVWQYDIVR